MSTDDGRDSFRHPRRQPINAPQGALAQINAGFARFLKEHSSPKHHRVTAGGRIVPMTLQHPAPVFKLPKTGTEAANHVKTEPLKESQGPKEPLKQEATSGNGNNTSQNRPHHGPGSKAIPIRAPPTESDRARAVSAAEHIDGQKLGQKVPTTTAPNPSNQQSRSLPSLNTGQQNLRLGTTSFDGIPIFNAAAVHQGIDQGGQLPFNTQMYPSQIIGPHIFSENLHQSLQLPVQPQASNVPGMYSLGAGYPFAATPQTAPANNGFNLISVTNYSSNAPLSGMGHDFGAKALLESAVQEYDNISNQLSGLDRYLALHTWDIDPATKKVLVEQRIELVRRLDSARVYKENLETILQTPRFETIGNGQVADQLFMTSNYGMQFSNAGTFNNYSLLQAGGYLQPGASSGSGGSAVLNPLSADAMNFNHPGRTINLGVDGLNGIYEHLQTGAEQIGTASYNWTSNKDFAMNNGPGSSNVYSMSSGNNEQPSGAGGPAASPSDLEMLYHRIERAARRKEPLEPFVKELAKLTASMNAMGIIDKHDDITQTGNHRGNLNHIESNKRQATCVGMMDPKSRSASGKVMYERH